MQVIHRVELTHSDLLQAVKEYIERNAGVVVKDVQMCVTDGQRDSRLFGATASVVSVNAKDEV